MARFARLLILVWAVLIQAPVVPAWADGTLTSGDLGWLRGNLNLAGDSPAVLDLTPAQQSRLHGLIAGRTNIDRKRQAIVQFFTEATDGTLQCMLDASTDPRGPPTELGANRPR